MDAEKPSRKERNSAKHRLDGTDFLCRSFILALMAPLSLFLPGSVLPAKAACTNGAGSYTGQQNCINTGASIFTLTGPATIRVPDAAGINDGVHVEVTGNAGAATATISDTTITNNDPTGPGSLGVNIVIASSTASGNASLSMMGTNSITTANGNTLLVNNRGSGAATITITGSINTMSLASNNDAQDGIEATTQGGGNARIDLSGAAGTVSVKGGNGVLIDSLAAGGNISGLVGSGMAVLLDNTVSGANTALNPNSAISLGTLGSGTITLNTAATLNTLGSRADGIRASARTGEIALTNSGAIATNGAASNGIHAFTTNVNANGGAIGINNSGAIDTQGASSSGILATTATSGSAPAGAISITSSGAINTTGTLSSGIFVSSSNTSAAIPTGAISVAASGPISTLGSETFGIRAASTTNTVQVSAANISAKGEFSTAINASGGGNVTINIAQGGSIMGGWQASSGGAGPTYGLPAAGIILGSTGGVATLTNDGSIGALSDRAIWGDPVIINNGVVTGFVQITAGATDFANNNIFDLRHLADTNGDGTRDTLRVAVSDLGPGTANIFANNGTLALLGGAGATTLDNTGQYLPLSSSANAMAIGGPVQGHLLGVATFTNRGTIDLQRNPAAGDVLLISGGHAPGSDGGGTFVSDNGRLLLDTVLDAGGPESRSDILVIDRATVGAGGATAISIHNLGGLGALTTGDGILVVKAAGNGATAPAAFRLDSIVAAGPYEYLLFHGGLSSGTENSWYLRNVAGPIPPEPPAPVPPDPQPAPPDPPAPSPDPPAPSPDPPAPDPPRPFYRMEAPLYSKITLLARQMGLLLLGTFHERQGDQYLLTRDRGAIWARVIGAGIKQKFTGPLVPSFEGTAVGAQIGGDAYVSDDGRDRAGLFASYAYVDGTVRGTILNNPDALGGQLPEDVITLGGYYTHIGDNGWYLDGVLMGSWFNAYPVSERGISLHTTGSGITASLEGAYPFVLNEEWTLEPMAQIVFTSMGFDSSADPYTTLDFQPADAWFGRIGARLEYDTELGGRPAKPYLELNLWHGFGGTDVTVYNSNIPVPIPFGNTDLQFAVGITSQVEDNASLIARVSHLISIDGNYQRATVGHIGLRYVW